MAGTLLNIKPILAIREGKVEPLERVRTRAKALARMGELIQAQQPIKYLALAASDDGAANDMLAIIKPVYSGHIEMFKLGAVIGTYAGPNAAGIFMVPEKR